MPHREVCRQSMMGMASAAGHAGTGEATRCDSESLRNTAVPQARSPVHSQAVASCPPIGPRPPGVEGAGPPLHMDTQRQPRGAGTTPPPRMDARRQPRGAGTPPPPHGRPAAAPGELEPPHPRTDARRQPPGPVYYRHLRPSDGKPSRRWHREGTRWLQQSTAAASHGERTCSSDTSALPTDRKQGPPLLPPGAERGRGSRLTTMAEVSAGHFCVGPSARPLPRASSPGGRPLTSSHRPGKGGPGDTKPPVSWRTVAPGRHPPVATPNLRSVGIVTKPLQGAGG